MADKLENIFSIAWPGSGLINLSLVKQDSDKNYKAAYFCFLSFAPGKQLENGSRTFDNENRINMKVTGDKVKALAYALKAYAQSNEVRFGKFGLFIDSSKSQYSQDKSAKTMNLAASIDQKTGNRMVTMFFSSGNHKHAFTMQAYDALAFADRCDFISDKCIELEYLLKTNKGSIGPAVMDNPGYGATPPPVPPVGNVQQNSSSDSPFGVPSSNFNTPEGVAGNFQDSFVDLDNQFM